VPAILAAALLYTAAILGFLAARLERSLAPFVAVEADGEDWVVALGAPEEAVEAAGGVGVVDVGAWAGCGAEAVEEVVEGFLEAFCFKRLLAVGSMTRYCFLP
jgi:hypothetical protein